MRRTTAQLGMMVLAMMAASIMLFSFASEAADFDLYVFSQGWPGTICDHYKCIPDQLQDAAYGFLLHGLWPDYYNGSYPEFCPGPSFNETAIEDLIPLMNEYWPSLYEAPSTGFWIHEWEKHGRCVTQLFPGGQHQWTETILNLRQKMDLLQILADAGIVPDGNNTLYTVQEVQDAIKAGLGGVPVLECAFWAHNPMQLWEVWVCMDKQLQVIDCPADFQTHFNTGCADPTTSLIMPSFKDHKQ